MPHGPSIHPGGGPFLFHSTQEISIISLRFRGSDLRPVLAEAIATQGRVILAKDVRVKLLAYAVGCNPDTDPFDDWWELARAELGGDDFGEFFDPKEGVFARILHGTDDLMLSATATHLSLEVVPPA